MQSKKYLLRATGLAALAVMAFFLLRSPAKVENRVVLDERRPAAAPGSEATLRNVTKDRLAYTIEPNPYSRLPRTRTLGVGAVDRIATDVPVDASLPRYDLDDAAGIAAFILRHLGIR